MSEEKQDRRALRTRETLINALLTLIENKHYDQITVQDIVIQANVGRSTFYAHYQNKDDLLICGFEHVLDMLTQQIHLSDEDQLIFDTSMFFQHAQGHYEIYKTLIWGSGFKLLINDGHAAMSQKIEDRLLLLLDKRQFHSTPIPVVSCMISGALLVLLRWWLENKMPYSPKKMDEFFQKLMMQGVQTALTMAGKTE